MQRSVPSLEDEDDDDGKDSESDLESIMEPLVATHLNSTCSALEENVSLGVRDGRPIAPSNDTDGYDADDENEGKARVAEVTNEKQPPGLHCKSPTDKVKLPPPSPHNSNCLGKEPTHCLDNGNVIPALWVSAALILMKTSSNYSLQ